MNTRELSPELFYAFKRELEKEGYFKRTYFYYLVLFCLLFVFLTIHIFIIFLYSTHTLVQMCNSFALAITLTQIGILGHDLSHKQVFNNEKLSKGLGAIAWGLFAGLSESRWFDKHNTHHKEVNHSEHDPDLLMPFIFADEQVAYKKDSYRSLRKYQHILFFLLLPLVYPFNILHSFRHIFEKMTLLTLAELVLILIHYLIFFWIFFSQLTFFIALVCILIFSLVTGTYMSLIFAPNHKGMPVIAENEEVEWWHQIVCTRNLYPNTLVFHLMGGLNYQIEHHLFTSMPRSNYPKVAPLVKQFCKKHNLNYYETTWVDSLKEIYVSLKEHRLVQ